ncbi:hypothetical protein GOZ91_24795 [Agrobacterium vitis]|nr:hypothetical protein [Agrobacterium vitis]
MFSILIPDFVVKEFDVQAVVTKAVLHDFGHRIEECLNAILGFEAPTGFSKGFGIKRC